MENKILIAGFGGQGVLFLGKLIAYSGLIGNMEVSWLPSYGPEMRGGTANCSVILSDTPVGSPIVSKPDVLIPMNLPSLEKFENAVTPNGYIIFDSSLIQKEVKDSRAFGAAGSKRRHPSPSSAWAASATATPNPWSKRSSTTGVPSFTPM